MSRKPPLIAGLKPSIAMADLTAAKPLSRQNRRALHTGSSAWRKLRERILIRDGWACRKCGAQGDEVDHVDGDASNNDPANLMTLCTSCHSHKTATEEHGRGP